MKKMTLYYIDLVELDARRAGCLDGGRLPGAWLT